MCYNNYEILRKELDAQAIPHQFRNQNTIQNSMLVDDINLKKTSGTSFWNLKKKRIALLLSLTVFALAAGGFLFWKYKGSPTNNYVLTLAQPPAEIPTEWVQKFFNVTDINDPKAGGYYGDPDKDELSNYQEFQYGTDPITKDTDSDGYTDGYEVAYNLNPLISDKGPIVKPAEAVGQVADEFATEGLISKKEFDEAFQSNRPLVMPVVPDSALHIIGDSLDAKRVYKDNLDSTLADYFSGQLGAQFDGVFTAQSEADLTPLKQMLKKITEGLNAMEVPRSLVPSHKDYIVYFGAMNSIVALQEHYTGDPSDYSSTAELIYQARILAAASGPLGDSD